MTRRAASDEYQFTLAALRVAKNHLWKERHTMPFTFKLSKRLARLKPRAMILALAALVACDQADRSLTSPSHPSFDTNSGNPDGVADLAVAAASDTSIALSFTEVDDGIGAPASYDVRYVVGPSLSWGSGVPSVARGTCAAPVAGTAIGSTRTCTVLGLTAGTTYSFQLVAFRGTLNVNAVFGPLSNVTTGQTAATGSSPAAGECATPKAGWIWCDDFEQNRLGQYFEYDSSSSDFVRAAGVGMDGSYGMRVHFAAGQVSAGSLHLAMGKVPDSYFRTVDAGTAIYRNVYWRMYVRNQTGWSGGGGYKLSRAISFATSNWAEAMMAHVWGDPPGSGELSLDPASGTDAAGNLLTTKYNDFANMRWLGAQAGVTPLFDASHVGQWYCVDAGTATITATSEGVNGSATVTVTTPTPTVPGTVSDLTIVGSTDSSVTLSFTEVNDGTGKPASYDVRSTAGASLTWSLAKSVTQGSCATPVTGTAIGSKRTCTVLGLVASTTYSVELVAFRGTLNVNAVFGDLSNVATGATQSPAPTVPGTVTDLALVGSTDSSVTLSFTEVNDGTGKPASYDLRSMAGSSLTWWLAKSVTQGSCATPVAGSAIGSKRTCTVLGLAAETTCSFELVAFWGTLNVNAVFGDLSNVATGTTQAAGDPPPPPSQPGTNPNEPAGFQRFGENDFTVPLLDYTAATGLLGLWRAEILDGNNAYVADAAAPKSPLPVFQGKYPAGWTAGYTPIKWEGWDGAANSLGYGTEMAQMYLSLWIRFPGADYENQSVGTKFFYLGVGESKASAGNQLYTMLYHPSGAGQTIASNL